MAGRENTGLHAALIIFVLITVLLAIFTYFNFRSAEESTARAIEAERKLKDQQTKYVAMEGQLRVLKFTLGWNTDNSREDIVGEVDRLKNPELTKIWDTFKRDMAIYGEGVDSPHYRNVPEPLLVALKSRNESFVVANVDKQKAQADVDTVRDAAKRTNDTHDAARSAALTDLTKVKTDFDAERARYTDENTKQKRRGDELQNKMNDLEAKYTSQIKSLQTTQTKTDEVVSQQRQDLEKYKRVDEFEVPDGKIMSVNQRTDTVIINLGAKDGLRTQLSFSVYPQAENSPTKAKKKAGIEVTRVIDDHLAEARIAHSELANPILPGDFIYSPVWHLGPTLNFALTGWLDVDGDGTNDRDDIMNLIRINNGVIDQWQKDDGSLVGTMTLRTKYLIDVAEIPERADNTLRQNRNTMIGRAKDLGVKRMYVKELTDSLGWQGGEKTTRLGTGTAATSDTKKKADPAKNEFPKRAP